MTEEATKYKANLQEFLDIVKDSRIEKIFYDIDNEPTFDKAQLPFEFKYCHSIKVLTNAGSFNIHTSMTSTGMETFWVDLIAKDDRTFASSLQLDLNAKSILTKNGFDNFPFKIEIDFGKSKLFIYAAVIYERDKGDLNFNINDEMILVFEKQEDSEKFEKLINYS